VIVDDTGEARCGRLRLLDYRLEAGTYRLQAPDAEGRVYLAIADVWPGIRRDHVVCYDAAGREIGDYVMVVGQAAKAEAQAEEAAVQARREVAVHAEAEERARQEAAAQMEAEERKAQSSDALSQSVSVDGSGGACAAGSGSAGNRSASAMLRERLQALGIALEVSYSTKAMASSC
jgi:colicin import membrane protein